VATTSANELYLLSRHNNLVDTLPLDDDCVTFDSAMAVQEGLEQLRRQFLALRRLSPSGLSGV